MPLFHAVVWTDHQLAQILQFGTEHVLAIKFKTHTHHTKLHGSDVRTKHEFFGEVCDTLDGIAEVLVTRSNAATADFRHYADKHWLQTAARIVAADLKLTHYRPLCRSKTDPGVLLALPKFWTGDKQGDHHGNVGKNQAYAFARQGVAA